jgi:SAM-dependent methyltransferase
MSARDAAENADATMSKKDIYAKALELRRRGRLYDRGDAEMEDLFRGSIDRFCEIACRLQHAHRVLDVGSGQGMLLSLLSELGHECHALDLFDAPERYPRIYFDKGIRFQACNVEVDPLPFEDGFFDAVVCCQVLEHFTHSHLFLMREIYRVLGPEGIVEVDVPNAVCFRNRSRMIRGKHITYDYEEHYLYSEPVLYNGRSFYPLRHNREFTCREVSILLAVSGFKDIRVSFLKSRRHREGLEKIRSLGSALRDLIPSLRKSIIAFAVKP